MARKVLDHITKQVRAEAEIMNSVDNHIIKFGEEPRECWLRIKNDLLSKGLIEDKSDNEIFARRYYSKRMVRLGNDKRREQMEDLNL